MSFLDAYRSLYSSYTPAPEVMPDFEERTPQHLRGIAAYEPEVTPHPAKEEAQVTCICIILDSGVVLSEVPCHHNLIEQEPPLFFIWQCQQVFILHAEHRLQQPHHSRGK